MLNKTVMLGAIAMAISSSAAFAHEIPLPTSGDPYILTEPTINWSAGVGTSLNNPLVDNQIAAYHFDVLTAGSVDAYTNDHDDANSIAATYIYQKDAVGTDWTLVKYSFQGPRIDNLTAHNVFGVSITGYINQFSNGTSDSGVRSNFDVGSYVAFVVADGGRVFGHYPTGANPSIDPTGAKLSSGLSWSWLTGDPTDLYTSVAGLSDFTIKASPGSLALVGPTVEVAAVPVPAAVWLMGSVLAGFGVAGRKKSA